MFDIRKTNVLIIGPRGAGKTTVGRIVAARLRAEFIDTDEMVTTAAGAPIAEIFAEGGEKAFRALEAAAVAEAVAGRGRVLALGGGAMEDPANLAAVVAAGTVIRLTAKPVTLHMRITADPLSREGRPSLTGLDPLQELTTIMEKRESTFEAAAGHSVEVDLKTPDQVAEEILRILGWREKTAKR